MNMRKVSERTVTCGASEQPLRVYSPPLSAHAAAMAVPSYPSAQDATTTNWAGFSSVSSTSYPVKLAGVVQDCVQRRELCQNCTSVILKTNAKCMSQDP